MTHGQMNELFTALIQSRQQGGSDGGDNGRTAAPAPTPEPVNYKELMDPGNDKYNPELAFKSFVESNYGTLIKDMNVRSVKGLYGNFRNQIHDFKDYESDIDAALAKRDPATLSEREVFGTYLTIKGMRALQKERTELAQKAGSTTHKPSTDAPPVTDEQLDATEQEIARVMFPNAPDPAAKYKEYKKKAGEGSMEVQVPLDATGKKG